MNWEWCCSVSVLHLNQLKYLENCIKAGPHLLYVTPGTSAGMPALHGLYTLPPFYFFFLSLPQSLPLFYGYKNTLCPSNCPHILCWIAKIQVPEPTTQSSEPFGSPSNCLTPDFKDLSGVSYYIVWFSKTPPCYFWDKIIWHGIQYLSTCSPILVFLCWDSF